MAKREEKLVLEFNASQTIAGPYSLFGGSFIIEFLEPPASLNATVLMKATYASNTPLSKLGKSHPQSPPLHLHFDQSETFLVVSGKVGTSEGWARKDCTWTKESGLHEIVPWQPHTFWPHPEAEEDTVMYVWAHPEKVKEPMDRLFFENLLRYVADVSDKKASMSIIQIMVTQHASATAMVWFPRAWWLGPLRWWVPYVMQGGFAQVGKWMGYRALMEQYTPQEEWNEYVRTKRA